MKNAKWRVQRRVGGRARTCLRCPHVFFLSLQLSQLLQASRDKPAPVVAVMGAAGKVRDKPRQVGPRASAVVDQTRSSVSIYHEVNEGGSG
jgi:hypothetical protein